MEDDGIICEFRVTKAYDRGSPRVEMTVTEA